MNSDRRQVICWEMAAVTFMWPIPWALAFLGAQHPLTHALYPIGTQIIGMFRDFGYIVILTFLLWNSGDALESFGFAKFRLKRDSLVFIAAFLSIFVCFHLAYWIRRPEIGPLIQQRDIGFLIAMTLYTLMSSAIQELLFRGYYIPRLEELLRNRWLAVFLSALLFTSIHIYEGPMGLLGAFSAGIVSGILFDRTRTLIPLIAAHFLINFLVGLHY